MVSFILIKLKTRVKGINLKGSLERSYIAEFFFTDFDAKNDYYCLVIESNKYPTTTQKTDACFKSDQK